MTPETKLIQTFSSPSNFQNIWVLLGDFKKVMRWTGAPFLLCQNFLPSSSRLGNPHHIERCTLTLYIKKVPLLVVFGDIMLYNKGVFISHDKKEPLGVIFNDLWIL